MVKLKRKWGMTVSSFFLNDQLHNSAHGQLVSCPFPSQTHLYFEGQKKPRKNSKNLCCHRWFQTVDTVIPKVFFADHWWSARLAHVVRKSIYKWFFISAEHYSVLSGQRTKKSSNHWVNTFMKMHLWLLELCNHLYVDDLIK